MGVPSLAVRRYFLSQISSEASWKSIDSTSLGSIFTTVFISPQRSGVHAAVRQKSKGKACPAIPTRAHACEFPWKLPDRYILPADWLKAERYKMLCRGQSLMRCNITV